MAQPVKLGLSLGLETAGTVTSTTWTPPATIAGTKLAETLAKDNTTPNQSLSPASLSLDASKPGILSDLGVCKTEACKTLNIGVTGGYRFGGVEAGKLALFAEYDFSTAHILNNTSVVVRAQAGGQIYNGTAFSPATMSTVELSGLKPDASFMAGVRTSIFDFPVSLKAGLVVGPGVDLASGFRAEGGAAFMATLSVDDVLAPAAKLAGYDMTTNSTPALKADGCKEAAAGLRFGKNALSNAVDKCKDSALPVFEAMAKQLKEFKVDATDTANHKEFRAHLKQFAEGIASAVKASKLTDTEAIQLMKTLAGHYTTLLSNMFSNYTKFKESLETALGALQYPIIPLLKANPADAGIKKTADNILNLALECAQNEGKDYLPNVLEQLVTMGTDSAWLKSHKKDLLDAAKKISVKVDRTDIEKSIQKTFK